ncbi:MAG TPA: gamma-glutamyltransferase [Methylomirabilota bacterium]|jgi:gamma-glutamyltranspeptidase/glutathione hydrolase|nr:gamma-glutamyltransferase [Methylomirabilota bacterium]
MRISQLRVSKSPVGVRHAAVTAGHPLGAAVGARVLRQGGNAVDAAVATAFAMAVVEPFMSCLAGGGSMLIHRPRRGESVALDFNVEAPAAAHPRMYRLTAGRGGDLFPWRAVEGDANVHGHRAVAVPGSVAGLCLALERYGTMDLRDVVAPAARLARRGVPIDWYLSLVAAMYAEELARFPEAARTYLRKGRFPPRPANFEAGDRLRQPALARSLELIGKAGPDAFYRGELAEAIEAELKRGGGSVTRADLAAYRVRVAPPLEGSYGGVTLLGMPGATGCVTALEALNILGQCRVGRFGPGDAETYHLRAEAFGIAFAERFRYLGDPEHVTAPWDRLLSPDHAARAARRCLRERDGRRRSVARRPAADCTTQVCAVDRERTLVSLTHTAVSLFGSKVVVPGTGLLLSNGMLWFDPEPGRANSIAPRKRALVNMTPFLALREGAPLLTLGAPGGRKIITAVPQVLSNLLDHALPPQAAVEAPRLHTEGAEVYVDDRVGPAVVRALRRRGHRVVAQTETYSTFYFARPQVIQVDGEGLVAGVDHLRPATAMGF